ncbi:MAG: hypothetical protein MI784_01855 [Cytophagales bacterium]|nr:hypothetical protein [Cytophagales bacterium]
MADQRGKLGSALSGSLRKNQARRKTVRQVAMGASDLSRLRILEELKDFIIPLAAGEYALLEQDIKANGIHDPLIVWERGEELVLIDGHNRYEIAQKHQIDLPKFKRLQFDNIEQVKDFMIDHQFARRNLTEPQKSFYRGLRYLRAEKQQGKRTDLEAGSTSGKIFQKLPEGKTTSEWIAEEYGVSERTIRNDANYAKGLEKLEKFLRKEVLSGKQKASKGMLEKFGRYRTEEAYDDLKLVAAYVNKIDGKPAKKVQANMSPEKTLQWKQTLSEQLTKCLSEGMSKTELKFLVGEIINEL